MPAPSTTEEFLDLVRKSAVTDEKRLDAYLQGARAAGLPDDPAKMAGLLVQDAILTLFQAEQILQGKWRRFTIGKYKVLERLGAGGMGSVYLCEHKLMRRRVAVKVLPTAKAEDPSSLERFYREARAVAALDHPNIVRAYDIDQDDKLHFLVMEYVDGANLQDIVKRSGPMEPTRAAHYLYQSALGLQHAHETKNLVHRDIKPGNILVDRTGVVKVLDMGLARFFDDAEDILTKKYDENVLGTADYLAPEQALDSHGVDIRADIYSLGATFYYCLTGRPPFSEGTVAQKLIWHQTRQPKALRQLRPEVPEHLAALVEWMMAKDPAARPQTPAEVARALEEWVSRPIDPPPEVEMPRLSPAALGLPPGDVTASGSGAPPAAAPGVSSGSRRPAWQVSSPPPSPRPSAAAPAPPAAAPAPPPALPPAAPPLPASASPAPPPRPPSPPSPRQLPRQTAPTVPAPAAASAGARATAAPARPPSNPSVAPPPSRPAEPAAARAPASSGRPALKVPPPAPARPSGNGSTPHAAPAPAPAVDPAPEAQAGSADEEAPWDTMGDPTPPCPTQYNPEFEPDLLPDMPAPRPSLDRRRPARPGGSSLPPRKLLYAAAGVAAAMLLGVATAAVWWALGGKSSTPDTGSGKAAARVLRVRKDVTAGSYRYVQDALRVARAGDRITVQGPTHEEELYINGGHAHLKNLLITPEDGPVVWRLPPGKQASHLLALSNTDGVRVQGFTFDGQGRCRTSTVMLTGRCPGTALQDVTVQGVTNIGVLFSNCQGDENRPVTATSLVLEGPDAGDPAVGFGFDFSRQIISVAFNGYITLTDCQLRGALKDQVQVGEDRDRTDKDTITLKDVMLYPQGGGTPRPVTMP